MWVNLTCNIGITQDVPVLAYNTGVGMRIHLIGAYGALDSFVRPLMAEVEAR